MDKRDAEELQVIADWVEENGEPVMAGILRTISSKPIILQYGQLVDVGLPVRTEGGGMYVGRFFVSYTQISFNQEQVPLNDAGYRRFLPGARSVTVECHFQSDGQIVYEEP